MHFNPTFSGFYRRALSRWFDDRQWWNQLAAGVMRTDWSWAGPALDYIELYYKALKKQK